MNLRKLFSVFLLVVFGAFLLPAIYSTPAFAFSDVKTNTSYKGSIEWMADNEVIKGYSDNNFKPDQCVTRAEFLKMLYKMAEVDTSTYTIVDAKLLPDADRNAWYINFIATGYGRKIISGYPDGKFKPNQCVNRAEAIKMAVLEFYRDEIPELEASGETALDMKENDWFYKYVRFTLKANLIGLNHAVRTDAGIKVMPAGNMTRAEVAELLFRIKAILDNEADEFDAVLTPKKVQHFEDKMGDDDKEDEDDDDDKENGRVVTLSDIGVKFNDFPFEGDVKVNNQPYISSRIYLDVDGEDVLIGLVAKPSVQDRGVGWADLIVDEALTGEEFNITTHCNKIDSCRQVETNSEGEKVMVLQNYIKDFEDGWAEAEGDNKNDVNLKENTYVFKHPWKWSYTLILTDRFLQEADADENFGMEAVLMLKAMDSVEFLDQPAYQLEEGGFTVDTLTVSQPSSMDNYFSFNFSGKYDGSCMAIADIIRGESGANTINFEVITRRTEEFCSPISLNQQTFEGGVVIDANKEQLAPGTYTVTINNKSTQITVD
ncbi:MAG: S-layer homology domain-containing protein [Patescibacteria group bacterium]